MIEMKEPLAAPIIPRDFAFYYDGLRERRLLVQECSNCGHRRHPPGPMCPICQSLEWRTRDVKQDGALYSYVVHHYPVFPDYKSPHAVALVQLEPDIRMTGGLFGIAPDAIEIGMRVSARFAEHADGFIFHYFVPVVR